MIAMSEGCTDADATPMSFEQALAELHAITHRLEEGTQGLEASLAEFERGVRLLRTCYQLLECAEQKIELLLGCDEEGRVLTTPFDASATVTQASPSPGKRRSAGRKVQPEIGFGDEP
jgi:exodeoxyribonuclease VII small subunit